MENKNTYVSFLTDEQIFSAIDSVFKTYNNKKTSFKDFNKSLVDPFEMIFSQKFGHLTEDQWVNNEALRQSNKSLSNEIGSFQEEIIGLADGFTRYKVGDKNAFSMDIISDDKTIIADMKNKHNTVKGSSQADLFNNLESALKHFPNATAYYVRIIDKKSQDKVWEFTSKGITYSNPNIRIISGDKFYSLVFGKDTAFHEFVHCLPKAISDFMDLNKAENDSNNNDLLRDIHEIKKQSGYKSLYETFSHTTFSDYDNF